MSGRFGRQHFDVDLQVGRRSRQLDTATVGCRPTAPWVAIGSVDGGDTEVEAPGDREAVSVEADVGRLDQPLDEAPQP